MSKDGWLTALRQEGTAFRAALTEAEPSAPVPSCPEWTVRNLVSHVGRIYIYVRSALELAGERPERPGRPDDDDLLPWFDEAFAALLTRAESLGADAPAWNWSGQPDVAVFWSRRMAHETSVHRWDAQMVSGMAQPIESDLAADGVSEVLDTFLPMGRAAHPNGATGLVRLTATDANRTWLVRLRDDGVSLLDESAVLDGDAEASTGVAGTAGDLVLALWGRLNLSALAVEGDPARFEALQVS